MDLVLSVIAAPKTRPMPNARLGDVAALLPDRAVPRWLEPGLAAEFFFQGDLDAFDLAALYERAEVLRFDFALQPARGRRKGLLVADMDSTITTSESLDDLAAALGLKDKIAAITARAMAGELDFEAALETRVALLKGLPERALSEVRDALQLTPGARTLVQTMIAHGAQTYLISGGFRFAVDHAAKLCGFHSYSCNDFEMKEGKLTGAVRKPILGRDAKRTALEQRAKELDLQSTDTFAVGDGANDLDMIKAAGLGVAFQGKPLLRAAARARVDFNDLTAFLYFQGYRRRDFVTG